MGAAIEPPENETAYPEPGMFGPMPAHGFYVRHARNVEFDKVEIAYLADDARPAFVLDDVEGVDFSRIEIQRKPVPDAHVESAAKKTL